MKSFLPPLQHDDRADVLHVDRSLVTSDLGFGQITYRPGGGYGPRIQRNFQLVIIHSGEAHIQEGNEMRSLEMGRIHFLKPGKPVHFIFSKTHKTHHSWCAIDPCQVPEPFLSQLLAAPQVAPVSETFERLFATAMRVDRPASPAANMVLEHLALSLLAEFLRLSENTIQNARLSTPVHKALAWIDHHFGEQDCMAKALQASGVSKGALSKQFRQTLGIPPTRYLWQFRTERALGLLLSTGLSISEIAWHCGFQSPFHCSRLVKQSQGVSPTEFRKQNWSSEPASIL